MYETESDFVLVEDFDSSERAHSTPSWEVRDYSDDRVAVKEIDPITESFKIHYIPKSVFQYVSGEILEDQ